MRKKPKKRAPKPSGITVSGDDIQIAKVDLSKDVTGTLTGELTIKFGGQTLSFPAMFQAHGPTKPQWGKLDLAQGALTGPLKICRR